MHLSSLVALFLVHRVHAKENRRQPRLMEVDVLPQLVGPVLTSPTYDADVVREAEIAARTLTALQIGMTAASGQRGGVDRYYFDLLRALPPLGVTSRGLVVGDATSIAGEGANIECFAPAGTSLLGRWRALRRAVARSLPKTDVVVSHFAPYAFPVLDQIRSKPFVVHFHGPWALESAVEGAGAVAVAAKRMIERFVYHDGQRFIVLSQAFARILEREYGVRSDAIRVIPGGVDVSRFHHVGSRDDARRALGWPVDRPTIVTVRRLVRAKGLEHLIDAATAIRDAIPDVVVHIVGTGPLSAGSRTPRSRTKPRGNRLLHGLRPRRTPRVRLSRGRSVRGADDRARRVRARRGGGAGVRYAGGGHAGRGIARSRARFGSRAHSGRRKCGRHRSRHRRCIERPHPAPVGRCVRCIRTTLRWPVIAARVRDVYREVA